MTYKIKISIHALKQLKKIDKQTVTFILSYIEKNLQNCTDPRVFGKSLVGNHKGKWRYRVGNYRILSMIDDNTITILILEIGHRKSIY